MNIKLTRYTLQMRVKSLRWDVSIGDKSLSLTCGVDMPSAEQDKPAKYMPFQRIGEKPEAYNLDLNYKNGGASLCGFA